MNDRVNIEYDDITPRSMAGVDRVPLKERGIFPFRQFLEELAIPTASLPDREPIQSRIDLELCMERERERFKREKEERKLVNRISKLFWAVLFRIYIAIVKRL